MQLLPNDLDKRLSVAVKHFWTIRNIQLEKQKASGKSDQGFRSAVTGGAHMDAFIDLITHLIIKAGIGREYIFFNKCIELPGFFRPTKEWDLLVVKNNQLVMALETKSQVGPSFGNNFNNRTEEAMGSALDLWTAYREGAYNTDKLQPWLGYLFLLENCPSSQSPVKVKEPHFKVFPEFINASYAKRYELFCRKLLRERLYNASSFITSDKDNGTNGKYSEPAKDLSFENFARSLIGHIAAFGE